MYLLKLQWRSFFRSASFKTSLIVKLLRFLMFVYFMGILIFLGIKLYPILENLFPDQTPLTIVNNHLIFWVLIELVIRFLFQKTSFLNVRNLWVLPIPKAKIVHFFLRKVIFSFFNLFSWAVLVPFAVILIQKGEPVLNTIAWIFSIMCLTMAMNLIKLSAEKYLMYGLFLIALGVAFLSLDYYRIYPITAFFGYGFQFLFTQEYLVLIPLFLLIGLYRFSFKRIKRKFYLEQIEKQKTESLKLFNLNWLNRWGVLGLFLKNDIRLIVRNKKPRGTLLSGFLFLFYVLFFYQSDIFTKMPVSMVFASMFVTSGFLLTFGQSVPAWDSSYFKMMMAQNFSFRKYLESKWYLMVLGTLVSIFLSLPYFFVDQKIYAMILAGACFNIGVSSFVTLVGGAFNRKRVELNQGSIFTKTNSYGLEQWIVASIQIGLPMIIFYIPYLFWGIYTGVIWLASFGLFSLMLKKIWLREIEKIYQEEKYKLIHAFEQRN